jgi:hypothetical protein
MRSLLLDELRAQEIEDIKKYLNINCIITLVTGLYWFLLPEEILTDEQKKIQKQYGPLKIAIEVGKTWVKFELFIRSSSIENIGSAYINEDQIIYIYKFIDKISKDLNLITCK